MKTERPKIREVILVEGRYDKNTLAQIVDATIVTTNGFAIFNDRQRLAFFRRLAKERGLILLTDSDGAGFMIRNFLKGAIPKEQIKQAYIPDVAGKERRKNKPGKEGKLGVEGMTPETLLAVLRTAGATIDGQTGTPRYGGISRVDLYELGLTGGTHSADKRKTLLCRLELPEHLSGSSLLETLNIFLTREELYQIMRDDDAKTQKNAAT